jgi:TRAP-type transport system large permease protein
VPALLLWLALGFTVWLTARRRGYPPEREHPMTPGQTAAAFRGGIWALLFPVFLLLGLRTGVFTPSEIGAAAVVYAVVIGAVVYRELRGHGLVAALEGSLTDIGAVIFLIALSAIFSYGIVLERVPERVAGAILGLTGNLSAVMALIALLVIVAGLFVDATVLIIMLTPIFLPLVRELGGDPVHFGMVFLVAATVGNFTPPVGAAMYAVCSILRCSIGAYTRESLPLLAAIVIVLLVLIASPQLVLFMPDLVFG